MAKKSLNTVIGLDINQSYVTLAVSDTDTGFISNVSIQPLDIPDGEDSLAVLKGSIASLLKSLSIKKGDVVVSLPGEYAIVKKIIVDATEDDIDSAIQWELEQQISDDISNYTFDYQKIGEEVDSEVSKYFVTAYKTVAIDRISDLVKSFKMNPVAVDLDIFSLINIFEINYPELKSDKTLIVHADFNKVKLIVTKNGEFIDVESLDYSDSDDFHKKIEEACNIVTGLDMVQLNSSLKVIFSGEFFVENSEESVFTKLFPTGEVVYPFRHLKGLSGMDEANMKKFGPQLAVSLGLAVKEL